MRAGVHVRLMPRLCAPLCRALLPLADWLAGMEPVSRTLPPQVRLLSFLHSASSPTVLC